MLIFFPSKVAYPVPVFSQGIDGEVELFPSDEHVVGVEGGDGEDARARLREWYSHRSQDTDRG